MFKVTVPEIKVVFFKVKWSTTLILTMGWRGVEGGGGGKGMEDELCKTEMLLKSHQRVDFIQQHFIPAFKPHVGL